MQSYLNAIKAKKIEDNLFQFFASPYFGPLVASFEAVDFEKLLNQSIFKYEQSFIVPFLNNMFLCRWLLISFSSF